MCTVLLYIFKFYLCVCVCVCVCVLYSQRPQLGHVVEAGQGDEGDVVVVEGAENQREEKRKTDC